MIQIQQLPRLIPKGIAMAVTYIHTWWRLPRSSIVTAWSNSELNSFVSSTNVVGNARTVFSTNITSWVPPATGTTCRSPGILLTCSADRKMLTNSWRCYTVCSVIQVNIIYMASFVTFQSRSAAVNSHWPPTLPGCIMFTLFLTSLFHFS